MSPPHCMSMIMSMSMCMSTSTSIPKLDSLYILSKLTTTTTVFLICFFWADLSFFLSSLL